MDKWILVLAVISLLVSTGTLGFLFTILYHIRERSDKSFEIASQLKQQWEAFAAEEAQARRQLAESYAAFETGTRERVDRAESVANAARDRLIKLEQYLKEFFEVELKTVFESFDRTVASILDEMKAELLRGVERIEDIQAVVDSKSFAQDRILDGEGSVYRLIADASEDKESRVAELRPDEKAGVSDEQRESPKVSAPEGKPRRRLRADEAE